MIGIGLMKVIISQIDINLILQEYNNWIKVSNKIINGKKDNKDKQMKITWDQVKPTDSKDLKALEEQVIYKITRMMNKFKIIQGLTKKIT